MIFDDSLSAVDAQTDAEIRHQLKEQTSSATVLLIAHRITTLMQADEIIVLSHGRVAERGTHEELLGRIPQHGLEDDAEKSCGDAPLHAFAAPLYGAYVDYGRDREQY